MHQLVTSLTQERSFGESPLTMEETLDWGVREDPPSSWIFCRWSPAGAAKLLERELFEGDACASDVTGDVGACRCRCDGDDARFESETLTGVDALI